MVRMKKNGVGAVMLFACVGTVLYIISAGGAGAYDQYSVNRDATNCAACHGDFRADPYNEGIVRDPACPPTCDPNTAWPSSLMITHSDLMVNAQCTACHGSGPRFPVLTGSSAGVFGNLTHSCAGCHGRETDGTGTGSTGWGAGLRQHHFQAGVTLCSTHHTDADPAGFTPVGEDVLPLNYAIPGVAAGFVPDDPCNAGTVPEDKVGSPVGLDNDGDGSYDGSDTDCGALAASPGETTLLTVTAHDPAGGILSLAYTPGCATTGNKIVFGPLQDVGSYNYTGEACAVGNTGTFNWAYPATPGSFFFILVGDNGIEEASYGKSHIGVERPGQTGGACPLPQDLSRRCDP